jgi:Holliday junction DNA helicase RuvB
MKKFLEWLVKPFTEGLIVTNPSLEELFKDDIKEEILSELKTSEEVEPAVKRIYRPVTIDNYIGQTRAKNLLRAYLQTTKNNPMKVMPHTLIYGQPGTGKTSLARLIAHETNSELVETLANWKQIEWSLNCIYDSDSEKNIILFIDEIHVLQREDCEKLYSIMEDFQNPYTCEKIKPFTIIGATTEIGEMQEDRAPFIDRFKLQIPLEEYTQEEIQTIIKQYRDNVYPSFYHPVFKLIAQNSRSVPRNAIRLLDATINLNNDFKLALDSFQILWHGFTHTDREVLRILKKNMKGLGEQAIATILGTNAKTYRFRIEPYLIKNDCVKRLPRGRVITETGLRTLQILESK